MSPRDPAGPGQFLPQSAALPPRDPAAPLRVLQVDPSLFTAPYDAALSAGLAAAGVDTAREVRQIAAFVALEE